MTDRFENSTELDEKLKDAALIAMRDVLGAKKDEKVLIITNPDRDVSLISQALYDASLELGAAPSLVYQPPKTQFDFAEPAVLGALGSGPDIAISMSAEKLGKHAEAIKKPYTGSDGTSHEHIFNYLKAEKKMRAFWSPTVTAEMFARTVPIDYAKMKERCSLLGDVLTRAAGIRISAPSGTDLFIGLKGRRSFADDGDFTEPGSGGNLPCGEVFISPELGTSKGTIAFDGSISSHDGIIVIDEPIVCRVEDGFVRDIEGGREAMELRKTVEMAEEKARKMGGEGAIPADMVETYVTNARNLGELGIGLNPACEIVGNMLEDEKVFRTCHIAIGMNYDEDAKTLIHLDGLIKEPTMVVEFEDGGKKEIMRDGELTV